VQGTGPQAQLTFKGVPKPDEVTGAPPAEIDSNAAAGRTDGALPTASSTTRAGCGHGRPVS
jgi:hypothetical protein